MCIVLLAWDVVASADIPRGVDFHAIWNRPAEQAGPTWTVLENERGFDSPYWMEDHLRVFVDNEYIPEWTKLVWVEVEWMCVRILPPEAPDLQLMVGQVVMLPASVTPTASGMGWTWKWEIFPQPENEIIRFPDDSYWHLGQPWNPDLPYYMGVSSVEIGTLCVPEPVTAALLGIGGVVLLRRRR